MKPTQEPAPHRTALPHAEQQNFLQQMIQSLTMAAQYLRIAAEAAGAVDDDYFLQKVEEDRLCVLSLRYDAQYANDVLSSKEAEQEDNRRRWGINAG